MSLSGNDVLALIERTHSDTRNEIVNVSTRLARFTAELEVLRQREIGVLSVLARIRMREIEGGKLSAALDETAKRMDEIVKRAEGGEHYDQMLGEGNEAGNALLDQTIQALIAQSKEFERDIAALELKSIQFEGSDSLDNPSNVR